MKYLFLLATFFVTSTLSVLAQQNTDDSSSSKYLDEILITTKQNQKNISTARAVESLSVEKLKANGNFVSL